MKQYVMSRVVTVISPWDSDKLKEALGRVPMMSEPGHKLFKYDAMAAGPTNWRKLKAGKRCLSFGGSKVKIDFKNNGTDDGDTLYPLKHVYSTFRSTRGHDGASEDVIVVMLPGLQGDRPENVPLLNTMKSLKALTPKHVGPKCGTIQIEQQELLRQVQARGQLWRQKVEHNIVFTYQSPPGSSDHSGGRKRMKYLVGGDTYVNNWPVPAFPMANMAKTTTEINDSIWRDATDEADSGQEDGSAGADTTSLGDKVIPFPQETSHILTREMISVWKIELVVELDGAAGQSMLAVLMENIRGVCVARNASHKNFIMESLVDAARAHQLVRHTPPAKSPELSAWESRHATTPPMPPTQLPAHSPVKEPAATSWSGAATPPPVPPSHSGPSPGPRVGPSPLAAFGMSRIA